MTNNRKNLSKLLAFIDEISENEENKWFVEELQKRFNENLEFFKVNKNINDIKEVLQIRGEKSLDYSFIRHKSLQQQLIIDNLRMENAVLSTTELNEVERFYNFCVNAFFQIENLINYYYHRQYPDIKNLLDHLESIEICSEGKDYTFKRGGRERSVADVNIYNKLNTFLKYFESETVDPYIEINLSNLRKIRNEGLHRCMVIQKNINEDKTLHNFFKFQDINGIRLNIIEVANIVKSNLNISQQKVVDGKTILLKGKVVNKLPSALFIKLENGESLQLPAKLYNVHRELNLEQELQVEVREISNKMEILKILKL